MKNYYIILLFILSGVSLGYGQSKAKDFAPIYTGPFDINGKHVSAKSPQNKNPFLFKQSLLGGVKYDHHTIKIKEGWVSLSLDLEVLYTNSKAKKPRVAFYFVDEDKEPSRNLYFWGPVKGQRPILKTAHLNTLGGRKWVYLTHEGKNIVGKHRIRFEYINGVIAAYLNGGRLYAFGGVGEYDYITIAAEGYQVNVSNLKINGGRY